MIRYLIDGRPLQGGSAVRGIGTYTRGLIGGLESLGAAGDVGLLLERGELPRAVPGIAVHPLRMFAVSRHLQPFLDPLQVRAALGRQRPSLYHAVEYAQPILPSVPVVATVHDLIPFVMSGSYRWLRRERMLAMHRLKHADALIAVSQATADDLGRIAGADPARITVIPEGVASPRPIPVERLVELRSKLRLPDRFLLAVGTFDPRKQIDLTVEVARRAREEHDVGLVIAGFQGSFAAAVERSVTRAGIAAHTRILGHVGTEQLAALYQLGDCLVFTSAYEGFGLPPLEAMAAGMPVAVFDNSSLAEVVGDAGLLIRDGNAGAMADAVSALLGDDGERRRLAVSGRERAAGFTWEHAAQATLTVYSKVLAAAA